MCRWRTARTSPARPRSSRPPARPLASDQNTTTLAATTISRLRRPAARAGGWPRTAARAAVCAATTNRSMIQSAETEQPQLLAGRRIDRQAIGVVGVALRAAHLVGVAIAPDAALAQQPVRGQPRAAEHQRRPPGVGGRARRRDGQPADHLDQAAGDEVHRDRQRRTGHAEIEVARDRQVGGERRDPRGGRCRAAARRLR